MKNPVKSKCRRTLSFGHSCRPTSGSPITYAVAVSAMIKPGRVVKEVQIIGDEKHTRHGEQQGENKNKRLGNFPVCLPR